MGNPISRQITIGTVGELLVQLRLLQFGVQAAAPIKDSGNDLIAVKGDAFRSIQIKTCTDGNFSFQRLPPRYHILAFVDLRGEDAQLFLDQSQIFLIPKDKVAVVSKTRSLLRNFVMNDRLVEELFAVPNAPNSRSELYPEVIVERLPATE
jgi:hypothetical protein